MANAIASYVLSIQSNVGLVLTVGIDYAFNSRVGCFYIHEKTTEKLKAFHSKCLLRPKEQWAHTKCTERKLFFSPGYERHG